MVKHKCKNGDELYLDKTLMTLLNSFVYNIKHDWDFVILITGDRMVRTGKSVLGMNVSAYLADRLDTPYSIKNVFFDSSKMIKAAAKMPKYSVIHYDEAREGLVNYKYASSLQQDLLDYFAECGQLNHIFVIVAPDIFELKENIAVARSELLLNVYRSSTNIEMDLYNEGEKIPLTKFNRGFFQIFTRKKKRTLYDMSRTTKRKEYEMVTADSLGRFTNHYPLCIDEKKYRAAKKKALLRFKAKDDIKKEKDKVNILRNKILKDYKAQGLTGKQISEKLSEEWKYKLKSNTINYILRNI